MKKFRLFTFLLAGILLPVISSAQKTVVYETGGFTGITVRNQAKVILRQAAAFSVSARADDELISKLVVEVRDEKLIIRFPVKSLFETIRYRGELVVTISMPVIKELNVAGPGSITGDGPVSSPYLQCYVSGTGSMLLDNLSAEKITAGLYGSGNLRLAGESLVSELKVVVSGSGKVNSTGLKTSSANITVSGSGSCEVLAQDKLTCRIAGSGRILYAGNPEVSSTIVGSGTVTEIQ